jgi:predicted metal-binding membrane protein
VSGGLRGTAAAASFLGMWVVMMVAMMLPSLVPMLLRYRRAVGGAGAGRMDLLTLVVGAGYFFVWTLAGVAVFALGAGLAAAESRLPTLARIVPIAGGMVVVICGALQFTQWKGHHLACWRGTSVPARVASADAGSAWRHGVRLAVQCGYCCGNLMAVLAVIGMMDLRAMAAATFAITAERLAPGGERVAREIGVVVVGIGLVLIARTIAIG